MQKNTLIHNHRFLFLDGMRGIAALAVICLHLTKQNGHPVFFPHASFAVDLFFCLSGFVIAFSYANKIINGMSLKTFTIKRIIRLYPMFILGLAIGVISLILKIQSGETDLSYPELLVSAGLNAIYLPYFNTNTINLYNDTVTGNIFPSNGPGWSLFFELIANIFFFFTITFNRKILLWLAIIFGGLLVYYELFIMHSPPGWKTASFIGGFPRVGYSFMMGVLIYKYFNLIKNIFHIHYLFTTALLIGLMQYKLPQAFGNSWLICTIIFVPIIVAIGTSSEIKSNIFKLIFNHLGRLSYPVYCLHIPLAAIFSVFYSGKNDLAISALLISAIYLISHILTQFYDEPIRAWLSKKVSS